VQLHASYCLPFDEEPGLSRLYDEAREDQRKSVALGAADSVSQAELIVDFAKSGFGAPTAAQDSIGCGSSEPATQDSAEHVSVEVKFEIEYFAAQNFAKYLSSSSAVKAR
jgi:hypothetical protein